MGKKIILLILLLIMARPAAAIIGEERIIESGAQMISNGIDAWALNFGDKLINASNFNGESSTDRIIFSLLRTTPDPFTNPWVMESRNTTAMLYTIMVFLFMFGGLAYVYLHTTSPSMARNIEFLVGDLKYFHLNNYLKNLVMALVFVIVVYMGYWLLLLLNQILTDLVLSVTLDSIIPKPDNFVLYLSMAAATFFLSIFMAWRILIIGWGAAYILVLAGMYLFNPLKGIAVKVFLYIVCMIYMQVALLSFAGAGVMIIQYLPMGFSNLPIFYTTLTAGLFFIGLVFVIGPALFLFFMKQGANVIKLAV